MKKIELKRMVIDNFKGLPHLEIDFSHKTEIIGANSTGKSSIYDAYLWCLFGKNAQGANLSVQPLDENNDLIHKLTTGVELYFDIDGDDHVFKRQQAEKWRTSQGTEVCTGTETTYFVNDVPCKAGDYKAKLDTIRYSEDWMIVSNVTAFMRLKTEDRRRKLNQIAGEVSDADIAEGFPNVSEALKKGKTVEEFKREVSAKKTKSKDLLDQIPARIDQQEKLRPVGIDFNALKKESAEVEKKISSIDKRLQAKADTTAVSDRDNLIIQRSDLNSQMVDIETSLSKERSNRNTDLENEVSEYEASIRRFESSNKTLALELSNNTADLTRYQRDFDNAKNEWLETNKQTFDIKVEPVCPECNRPYTQEQLSELNGKAVEKFNSHKLTKLSDFETKANEAKALLSTINESIVSIKNEIETNTNIIGDRTDIVSALRKKIECLPSLDLLKASNSEYKNLKAEYEALTVKINSQVQQQCDNDESTLQDRKKELNERLKEITTDLAKESLNEKIDKFKSDLDAESKVYSQAVSDMEKIEFEIQQFQKQKIEMVENAISSLFSIVRWKMFEQNLTNDGEKAICEAIVNGVPYEDLNTAMKINAGIDICNALSSAYGISVPLFIDNRESVTNLIETSAQTITLQVVAGQKLTIH